jgi:predicted membrane-bound spermidine synthase
MNQYLLLTIILIEGFVSIATEIITIRQLLPVVGNSVMVTSFIIGIFLLALAYGYKRGGKYQKDFAAILARNFIGASLLLAFGLSSNFITIFFKYTLHLVNGNDLSALVAYLILITAPLAYLLGQTLPLAMNLINNSERASSIGGKVLHLSTLGSFLGSILTTILFMNYLGVAWTILLNSFLLIIAGLILNPKIAKNEVAIFSIMLIPGFYFINAPVTEDPASYSNAYSNYRIIDNFTSSEGKVGKILAINNSASSFLEYETLAGVKYIEVIKDIINNHLQLKKSDILVLGAGGFSLSANDNSDNNYIYVDIDPDLPKVALGKFVTEIKGKFIAADARSYLRKDSQKYAVIVSDAFSSKTAIPSHLTTLEYFKTVAAHLKQSGVAIFNVILDPRLADPYSQKIDNTIRAAFSGCMVIPVKYGAPVSNVVYVCNKLEHKRQTALYTDNLNKVNIDLIGYNALINSGTATNKSATNP